MYTMKCFGAVPRSAGLATAVALLGCSPEGGRPPATMRDSAGVTIVENWEGAWTDDTRWRLLEPPDVVIGDATGETSAALYRVTGALLLESEVVVVASHGTTDLRFFDGRTGRALHSSGRAGDGPGEFRSLEWFSRFGADSLLVWDYVLNRGTVFAADGVYGRTLTLEHESDVPLLVLTDRSIVATPGMQLQHRRLLQDRVAGPYRAALPYLRYDAQGLLSDTIGVHPGSEAWVEFVSHLHDLPRVFGAVTVTAASGSLMWVGTGVSFCIEAFDTAGALVRRAAYPAYRPPPLNPADVDAWIADAQGRHGEQMAQHLEEYYANMAAPATPPPYDRMLADDEGNLWVERYTTPRAERRSWFVFTPVGALLGVVDVPGDLVLTDVRRDRVIGIRQDSLDVEYVHAYRVLKPSNPS